MPTRAPLFRPHQQRTQAEYRVDADNHRGSAHARGYDRTWQRLRDLFISEHPTCKHCWDNGKVLRPAQVVDHIIPIAERPDLRLSETNLQALCQSCHSSITARHDGGYGNAKHGNKKQ